MSFATRSALGQLRDLALELLSPARCAACDERAPFRTLFCEPCARTIVRAPRRAPFLYGGAIARALRRLKYEDRPDLARGLGEQLISFVPARRWDVIVPVPLHPGRLAERGYNQAALLAGPLARALGIPLETRLLFRNRDTCRQADLGRSERLANVRAAFGARRGREGLEVLLVDDVRTTGATLAACRAALALAGITTVNAVTVAIAT